MGNFQGQKSQGASLLNDIILVLATMPCGGIITLLLQMRKLAFPESSHTDFLSLE